MNHPFKKATNPTTCLQKILRLIYHRYVMKQHTTLLRSLAYRYSIETHSRVTEIQITLPMMLCNIYTDLIRRVSGCFEAHFVSSLTFHHCVSYLQRSPKAQHPFWKNLQIMVGLQLPRSCKYRQLSPSLQTPCMKYLQMKMYSALDMTTLIEKPLYRILHIVNKGCFMTS